MHQSTLTKTVEKDGGFSSKLKIRAIRSFQDEYFFLSNTYPCKIQFMGDKYPSVEHAYQSAKVMGNGKEWKEDVRIQIRNAPTPRELRQLGNRCPLRNDWHRVRVGIMKELVAKKFKIPEFKQKLLDTGEATLVSGNSWNAIFWGVSYGVGENNLGKILMEIRSKL